MLDHVLAMRTWICIGILALCSLSCGEEAAQPQAPSAPTIDDLVLANMLAVQEAAEALIELQGVSPVITVDFVGDHIPTNDSDYRKHLFDGLRKAGLPE